VAAPMLELMESAVRPTPRGQLLAADRSKLLDLDGMVAHVTHLRAAGKRIVHCHGVFDLLHVGHVRHFKAAKALGDVLVVTITQDAYVNKGPNRPAFGEKLRAETIAALEDVDFVAISGFPTAVEVITRIRPDVYAKGPDYRDASLDHTGGITLEREAVEAVGGRIAFTDGVTFSSSNLINRYFPPYPAEVEGWLQRFRDGFAAGDVIDAVKSFVDLRVLVVGEAILDEYVYCDQMGKAAKEPVLAMRYSSRERFAGGALAVANHLAGFCRNVELLTFLGDRDRHEDFVREHLPPNVAPTLLTKRDSPTIVKRRYVEGYLMQKLFEVYEINDELLEEDEESRLCSALEERLDGVDVVVVSDFGHGILTPRVVRTLGKRARFLAVNTQINAANIGFHTISKYKRADYVCVHEGEVRLDARSRRGDLEKLVADLADRLDCDHVLVTRGKSGCTFVDARRGLTTCPAFTSRVVDRIGSGDAVLAVSSLAVARGLPGEVVAFLANVVGAQAVQIVGNRSAIDRTATLKFIETLLK
jgi:rfaE bifunctional protein kinase chain/domain/rfaE bifunctional protein nucleotidyltransferase chain/domain